MSKQAIKSYFQHGKELRMRASVPKVKVDDENEEVYVVDQTKLDEAFAIVQDCNLIYKEEILIYFRNFDQEEYDYILSRKNDLSPEMQNLLWPEPIKLNCPTKLKLVELTDEMYTNILKKQVKERNKKLDDLVKDIEVPSRPSGELDLQLSKLQERLEKEEKRLEEALKNTKPKAYVPPAMRQKMIEVDPKIVELKNRIQTIKNEITSTQLNIETQNGRWKSDRLFEIRQEMELEMLELP